MRVMPASAVRLRPADLLWLLPVVAFEALYRYPTDVEKLIGAVVGVGVVALIIRAPGRALTMLV